ncbi:MAG: hypothetical protein AB7W59_00210 [Acidimicrobiia bacterium]
MIHDHQCAHVDTLHQRIVAHDAFVAKAAQLTEVAQMAKKEQRLREYLLAKWNIRVDQAVKAATSGALAGQKAAAIAKAIDRIMSRWARDVDKVVRAEVADIYRLARIAGHKKATKQTKQSLAYDAPNFTEEVTKARRRRPRIEALPRFDVVDREAAEALGERQMLWLGSHYGDHVQAEIATTTRTTMVEAGASRRTAGRLLQERARSVLGMVAYPGGFRGTAIQYFEGVAANAATVARAYGQMRSFARVGITRYTIVNPNDSRTCAVCGHMDQKVFTVAQGLEQIRRESAARTPDDLRRVHPWLSTQMATRIGSGTPGRLSGAAGTRDSAAFGKAGLALPPFHFRCRCAVDVDEEAGSFDDLSPSDFQ